MTRLSPSGPLKMSEKTLKRTNFSRVRVRRVRISSCEVRATMRESILLRHGPFHAPLTSHCRVFGSSSDRPTVLIKLVIRRVGHKKCPEPKSRGKKSKRSKKRCETNETNRARSDVEARPKNETVGKFVKIWFGFKFFFYCMIKMYDTYIIQCSLKYLVIWYF